MNSPTAVSLFAGVGGIDLALERAGFHITSAVEINDSARGVLADRFPDTTLHNDVTKVTADELRADGFVPERGLVAAGFPCQDLSVAGRRKGMGEGTRSGLYWHVVRLLAELRPRWVLLENVPGLLSAVCICPGDERCQDAGHGKPCGDHVTRNKRKVWVDHEPHSVEGGSCAGGCMVVHGGAMGAVLGSLGDLGYGFAYRVLDAQFTGVPQRRRRVVIVGCLGDDRRPVEVLLEPEGRGGDHPAGQPEGARVAADLGYGVGVPGRAGVANTLTARDAKGPLPDKSLGNVVIGSLTAHGTGGWRVGADEVVRSGERDADGNLPPEVWANRDVAATLNCGDNASESRATELVVQPLAAGGKTGATAIGEPGDPYPTLRAGDGGSSRQSLIAVTTTGDKAHTLTAEGHDASEDGTGRGTPVVAFHLTQDPISGDVVPSMGKKSGGNGVLTETTVRRLTPRECERLQGFPDDWTATSNGRRQSDSPRYQQMGNAVAVPVFEWVARRIREASA